MKVKIIKESMCVQVGGIYEVSKAEDGYILPAFFDMYVFIPQECAHVIEE